METHDLWVMLVLGWLVAAGALISWICETIQNRRREKAIRDAAAEQFERLTAVGERWHKAFRESETKRRGDE